MNGLIVTNAFVKPSNVIYKIRRLKEEFLKRDVTIKVMSVLDIDFIVERGRAKISFDEKFDFAIFLDKDKYTSVALESYFPIFDSALSIALSDDKMTTYMTLLNHDIPMPRTIPAPLNYDKNPCSDYIEVFLNRVEKEFGYPLICKECYGSLGKQVYLIKTRAELEAKYDLLKYKSHLYQEFIKSHIGEDYRIIVIGGKVIASMKRVNTEDFRSNIALGGHGYDITPPQEFLDLAIRSCELLQLDYAGVDLLIDEYGHPLLNEINSNAFFSGIEETTNINIAGAFAQHIINKITAK